MELVDDMETCLANGVADQAADGRVTGPQMAIKVKQSLLRFDHQAMPPPQVKRVGHVIGDGVTRADVHVKPRLLGTESSREMVILEALCVREFHCGLGSDE